MGLFDFFKKKKQEQPEEQQQQLNQTIEKTKKGIFSKLTRMLVGKKTIDDQVLDELEEILLSSDVGVETTVKIINQIRQRVAKDKYLSTAELDGILKEEILQLLFQNNATFDPDAILQARDTDENGKRIPYVILVVGVNGVGKTTTIGKLAHQFKLAGNTVILGAADTFRAAAVDQLKIWGQRAGVQVVEKGMGVDPSAVAFEATKVGVEIGADVVIIDTAGRLHNRKNLMAELSKIRRIVQKFIPQAPQEVLLVLDASTGQNAIIQAEEFTSVTEVNAIALTKLDGTAKGGVVIGISDRFRIPVKYIGVGEKIGDLQLFDTREFVESLFKRDESDPAEQGE
jgi:fused signal recognition particle receptor